MKTWQGNPNVWILNDHGNREGIVKEWHDTYRMWLVEIKSGHGKGTTVAFREVDLQRK